MKCVELAYIHPRALVLCRDFDRGKYIYSIFVEPAEEWKMQHGVSGKKLAEFASSVETGALDAAIDYILNNAPWLGFDVKTILHHVIYMLLTRGTVEEKRGEELLREAREMAREHREWIQRELAKTQAELERLQLESLRKMLHEVEVRK